MILFKLLTILTGKTVFYSIQYKCMTFLLCLLNLHNWLISTTFYCRILKSKDVTQLWNKSSVKCKTLFKKLEYSFLVESTKLENRTFSYRTTLSKVNVKANRLESIKWIYHRERSFSSSYFIFSKILFQFKTLELRVNLMYQPPKCPYSYFSKALEFHLRVLFLSFLPSEKFRSKEVKMLYLMLQWDCMIAWRSVILLVVTYLENY